MYERLKELLEKVPRTYEDFQMGTLWDCANNEDAQKQLIDFILANPDADSGKITKYLFREILHKEPMKIIIVDDELDDE